MSDPHLEKMTVEQLAEDYLERRRSGERPSISEYTERYPELADQIRDCFPALRAVEDFKPDTEDLAHERRLDDACRFTMSLDHLGDYHIIREVGRGGMGIVYEAEQESLGRRVALKVLPKQMLLEPKYKNRFTREAKVAANLHHTNIVPVFGVGEHEGMHYYAMQFIHGLGLDEVLVELREMRKQDSSVTGNGRATVGAVKVRRQAARQEVSAVAVAQSLVTGQFAKTAFLDSENSDADNGPPSSDQTRELQESSPPDTPASATHITTTGRLSETFSITGSVTLPGQSSASTNSRVSRNAYWQSVARIGVQVAEALQYAHDQGTLHRDVKPSNLLLDTRGTVWVTDFGLAKAEDHDSVTRTGDVVGTLRYMAPEMFSGHADVRSDVYAIGLTLYELLALQPAFGETDQRKLIEQATRGTPQRLRKLDPQIPRDLETIVHKAIDRDPSHRYQTAQELAADLQRYWADEPICARRISPLARFGRWCRRNRVVAALSFTITALLVAVAAVSVGAAISFQRVAEANRKLAEDRNAALANEKHVRGELTHELFHSGLAEAQANRWSGRIGQRLDALEAIRRSAALLIDLPQEGNARLALRNEAIAALAMVDLKETASWRAAKITDSSADISPDLTMVAVDDRLGTPPCAIVRKLSDLNTAVVQIPLASPQLSSNVRFSPHGTYVAGFTHFRNRAIVMHVGTGKQLLNVAASVFEFSQANDQFAVALADGATCIYQLPGGEMVSSFRFTDPNPEVLMFSPVGRALAAGGTGSECVEIRDIETGAILRRLSVGDRTVESLAWSPDGNSLVAGCSRDIRLWDLSQPTDEPQIIASGHDTVVTDVDFICDGQLLVSSAGDGTTRIWSAHSGDQLMQLAGRLLRVDETGRQFVVTRGLDFICYEIIQPETCHRFYQGRVLDMALRNDGRLLALAMQNEVCLWDLRTDREVARIPLADICGVAFDATTGNFLTSGAGGVLQWPVVTASEMETTVIGPPRSLHLPLSDPAEIRLSNDGQTIVVDHGSEGNRMWGASIVRRQNETTAVIPLRTPFLRGVAVSPDGKWVATGNKWGQGVNVWDASNGQHVTQLTSLGSSCVAFSPDNRWLVSNSGEAVRFWEVGSWSLHKTFPAAADCGSAVGFTSDSGLAALARTDRRILLVNMKTSEVVAMLEAKSKQPRIGHLLFTPSGDQLIASVGARGVYVWDLRAIRRSLGEMQLDWELPDIPTVPPAQPLQVDVRVGIPAAEYSSLLNRLNEGYSISKRDAQIVDSVLDDLSSDLAANPDDAEAWVFRGRFNWVLGRDEAALSDFTEAIRRSPDHVEGWYQRARTHWWRNDVTAAIPDYEEVLRLQPDHGRATFEGAMCYAACPANDESSRRAVELADAYLPREDGHSAVMWYTKAQALYRLGRIAEAEEALQHATQLGCVWLRPDLTQTAIHHAQGQLALALREFHQAVPPRLNLGHSSQNALQNYVWQEEIRDTLGLPPDAPQRREDGTIIIPGDQILLSAQPTEGRILIESGHIQNLAYTLRWCPSHVGSALTCRFPDIAPGRYRLHGQFGLSPWSGQVTVQITGSPASEPFDSYAREMTLGDEIDFGEVELTEDSNEIRFEVVGSHSASDGHLVLIHRITLTPIAGETTSETTGAL